MTYLVTGATGAIGSAIVAELQARSETVIAHGRSIRTPSNDGTVHWIGGDLLAAEGQNAVREASAGGLAGVIAAHGVPGSAPLADLTRAFTERVMRINFESLLALLEVTLPALRRCRGRFVAVASQAGLVGEPDNAAYSASKFAVVGWIRHLAGQAGDAGITYHALCAGCTESPLLTAVHDQFARAQGTATAEEFAALRQRSIPVGRFATPHETAAAAVYLATADGPRPTILAESGGEVVW
ncbi:SDR family NAD(P)-dependent oxidoreductase [Amycolatopsis sp. NPDC001319]|uniref:SDR family NAD(P)-dependent oxidoreductase n=1 Tax=unclassified Amycolatopsis TaxID=2618356 RepID=UPI00368F3A64